MSALQMTDLAVGYGPGGRLTARVSGLGDQLRVGPQYMPPAMRGTPIIMRGPHGQRFAPLAGANEKGVRFWNESTVEPLGNWYQPQQRVVGVMGMGQLKPDADSATKGSLSAQARQLRAAAATAPFATTMSAVPPVRAQLQSYNPWTDYVASSPLSWIGITTPYDSSQTILSNLSDAEQIAGATYQQAVRQSGPISPGMATPLQVTDTQANDPFGTTGVTPPGTITSQVGQQFDAQHPGWAVLDPNFSPIAVPASWFSTNWKTLATIGAVGAAIYYGAPIVQSYMKEKTAFYQSRGRSNPGGRRRRRRNFWKGSW